MRIGGIASGIDTESIIRDMMKAHRLPLDKITQKKQYTQWQLDDYRSTNRDLRKSGDKLFDTVMKQGTYLQKTVNVSDDKSVSIGSKNSPNDFSGTIEVTQLAKQATLQSGGKLIDPTTGEGGTGGTGNLTDAAAKTKTLTELGLFTGTGNQELTITVGGKAAAITIKAGDTLDSVLSQINEKSGASAFYDSQTGKIAMSAKNSGAGTIEVTNTGNVDEPDTRGAGDLAEKLKFTIDPDKPSNPTDLDKASSQGGLDAKFILNGLATERPSNTFNINGLEVSLKAVTTTPVTFSSSTDTQKIMDSVVGFVNDYNEMIEKLNSKIKEKTFKSFQPLSDEQKADMKEDEIKKWEEKAMSGTLRNDPALSTMLSNLRSIMSKAVETTDKDGKTIKISLKDLGIETSKNYLDNGKLTINEDKLREKITENPNAIYDLIGKADADPKKAGIAHAYRQELQDAQKKISEKAGSSTAVNDSFAIGRSMKSMDKQIERFEKRLEMMEDRYWKQFNAMEMAMQRANAQSAQLMSSLGGGM